LNDALFALLKGVEYKATQAHGLSEEDYARLETRAAGTERP
jgi:hypothetical protein